MLYIYQMLDEESFVIVYFLIWYWLTAQQSLASLVVVFHKMHDKTFMPKKATKSRTQGIRNKILKKHIDLTGSNKVPTWD